MNNQVLIFKDIKNKRWTAWSLDRKTHLGYYDELTLENCSFIVLDDKRKKIVKSKKRFPHAWVIGEISKKKIKASRQISYNPFEDKTFVFDKSKKPIKSSKKAVFSKNGKVFI